MIHTDWGPVAAAYPSWSTWFEVQGLPPNPRIRHGLTVNSSRAALDLAEHGLGIALGQGIYVAPLLDEGRLAVAMNISHRLSQPYCLTVLEQSARKPVVGLFRDWLSRRCIAAIEHPGFGP